MSHIAVTLASILSSDTVTLIATRGDGSNKRIVFTPPINLDRLAATCHTQATEHEREVKLYKGVVDVAVSPRPQGKPERTAQQGAGNIRDAGDEEVSPDMSGPPIAVSTGYTPVHVPGSTQAPPTDGIVDALRVSSAGYQPTPAARREGQPVSEHGLAMQRKEFERMPLAIDACNTVIQAVRAEQRVDALAPTAGLRMNNSGLLVLPVESKLRGVGSQFSPRASNIALEPAAIAALFTRVCTAAEESSPGGAVATYRGATLTRARSALFNGLATHLGEVQGNTQGGGVDADNEVTLVRTRLIPGPNGELHPRNGRCAYAVASKSYAPCDADKIAEEIIEALSGAPLNLNSGTVRGTSFYDGTRSHFDLVMFTDLESDMFRMGDAMKYALRITADDACKSSINVSRGLYRPKCSNMAIFAETQGKKERFRHSGSSAKLVVRLRDALRNGLAEGRQLLTVCEEATKAKLTAPGVLVAPGTGSLQRDREELLRGSVDAVATLVGRRQNLADPPILAQQASDRLVAGAFRGLIDADRLTCPSRLTESTITHLVAAHNDEVNRGVATQHGPTRASLVNAVTLYAHAMARVEYQARLETEAGALMQSRTMIPWLPAPV